MADLEPKLLARFTVPTEIARAYDAGIRQEHFEDPLHQSIWCFALDYWRDSGRTSAPTRWILSQEFPGYTPVEADEEVFYLAEKLRARYATNQLQEMMRQTAAATVADPLASLQTLKTSVLAASETVVPRRTAVDMAVDVTARRERYCRGKDTPQGLGVPYGLPLLDSLTGGILPGELAVIGAMSKSGKTFLLCHVIANVVKLGYRPVIFTLEMSIQEVEDRIDAMFSTVSYDRLSRHALSSGEVDDLYKAQDRLAELGGVKVERPEEGDRTAGAICVRARQLGCDLLLIDQLSHMEAGHRTSSLKEHHSSVLRQLRNEITRAGQELPTLLAVQMRRQGDEELSLESFANAAEIERDCDIAIGLHRNRELRNNHLMELHVLGSRRSDIGKYLCRWELTDRTEFSTLEPIR